MEAASQTTEWKKHVESGRLRLLDVYGDKRMADFPEAPTLRDLGYPITAASLGSVIGPKGLPPRPWRRSTTPSKRRWTTRI